MVKPLGKPTMTIYDDDSRIARKLGREKLPDLDKTRSGFFLVGRRYAQRRSVGPHLMCFDELVIETLGSLQVYIRQCHAERDLEQLARVEE